MKTFERVGNFVKTYSVVNDRIDYLPLSLFVFSILNLRKKILIYVPNSDAHECEFASHDHAQFETLKQELEEALK